MLGIPKKKYIVSNSKRDISSCRCGNFHSTGVQHSSLSIFKYTCCNCNEITYVGWGENSSTDRNSYCRDLNTLIKSLT